MQTDEAVALQETGVYQYRHVLADAEAYKSQLASISEQMRAMVAAKTAVTSVSGFRYNESLAKGRKFVGDLSKLMLRAYNAEAENCVRVLKAETLAPAIQRMEKSVRIVERLGAMISLQINPQYHARRVAELELTADYLAKKQEERRPSESAALSYVRSDRRCKSTNANKHACARNSSTTATCWTRC
ncbi:MAG: DUF4041 domain-containing protein [Nocardioidaceae bacterium]